MRLLVFRINFIDQLPAISDHNSSIFRQQRARYNKSDNIRLVGMIYYGSYYLFDGLRSIL